MIIVKIGNCKKSFYARSYGFGNFMWIIHFLRDYNHFQNDPVLGIRENWPSIVLSELWRESIQIERGREASPENHKN